MNFPPRKTKTARSATAGSGPSSAEARATVDEEETPKGHNRSLMRALVLLRDIATNATSVSFSELQKRHGLPKATLHNLLSTLENQDYIERDDVSGRYRVGLSVLELAAAASAGVNDLGRLLYPVLEPLVEQCKETCHLGVLDGFDEVILRRIDHARQIVQVAPQMERRHPAHSTSGGLAALALMGKREVQQIMPDQLIQRTPNTIQTQETLFARLSQIRTDGYSLDNEEAYLGVRCIAVAVDAPGWPIVTISFTLPLQRAPVKHLVSLAGPLQTAARRIRDILIVTPRG